MWFFLLACDLTELSGGTPTTCEVQNEGPVPADFTTVSGYSANDVGGWLVRTAQAELTYAGSGASTFTEITATTSGDPILRDYAATSCSDVLALSGTLQVYSQDGAFAESIEGEFVTTSAELAGFSAQLDSWSGNYVLQTGDGIRVEATFTPGDTTGTISSWTTNGGTATIATWVDDL